MTLKPVQAHELTTLLQLAKTTFIHTYQHLNNPDDFKTYLEDNFTLQRLQNEFYTEGVSFYFLETTEIVGYIKLILKKSPLESDEPNLYESDVNFVEKKGVEIERIYVLEAFKGIGAGRFMIEKTVEIAQTLGLDYIWLGVWAENEKAIPFYEKMGFTIFGEHIFRIGSDKQLDYLMLKMC